MIRFLALVKDAVVAFVNLLTRTGVLVASFVSKSQVPLDNEVARWVGITLVYSGMAIAVWAGAHLKAGTLGIVEPRLNGLITGGPFRYVRHPVYLGMSIAMLGVAIALRSWLGLATVLLLFLPSEVHRAFLEERGLRRKFGRQWETYANRTGFFLPRLVKRKP